MCEVVCRCLSLSRGFKVCPCCVHQEFVPFYFWMIFSYFSAFQLMDIWVVATSQILRVVLLCLFTCKF